MESGLFGPGSVTWRVHADPVFPIAGVRALIMQALHPLTMAAVAQQRGFEEDFWGRLDRTGQYVSTLTYAPETQAKRTAAKVRGIHRKLVGTNPATGETFRLDRPDLLLWVHCCEVDSFLSTARRAGAPITPDDADEYLREQVLAATLVGIPAEIVPSSVTAMKHYFQDIRPQLELTDDATRGVKVLISPPMPKKVRLLTPARPAWAGLAGMAFALMPGWARKLYRMPGLPTTDLAATGALRALRTGLQVLPDKWTGPPEVLAARAQIDALDEQRAQAMDSDGQRAG
ncbi:oxygenase MpaB family protein [Nakamurella sp. GG22]